MLCFVLLLPLFFLPSEAAIECYVTSPITGLHSTSQCYQNWCKRTVGGSGKVEYGCDQTGDCARNNDNNPYDPYITQIRNSWRRDGRETACCNFNYCNSTGSLFYATVFLILMAKTFVRL